MERMIPMVFCIPKIFDKEMINCFNKNFKEIFEIRYGLGKIYKICELTNKDNSKRYIIYCELNENHKYFNIIKSRLDENNDIKLYYDEEKFTYWKLLKAFFQPSYSKFKEIKKKYNCKY